MEKSKPVHWWIFEDALRDRSGHWLEYLQAFQTGLKVSGDKVRFFTSKECLPEVSELLHAEPLLPPSIWARMSDGAPKWRRLLRIPAHGLATYRAVRKLISTTSSTGSSGLPDVIFVPTVLVHHLMGWMPLIKSRLFRTSTRVLLFFPNAPVLLGKDGASRLVSEPTAKLFRLCIRSLAKEVRSGAVILGAETIPMTRTLSDVTGVPFVYMPHVVTPIDSAKSSVESLVCASEAKPLIFGAYGANRHEKGTDLLQKAIRLVLTERPNIPLKFIYQWTADMTLSGGAKVQLDSELKLHPKVEVIERSFAEGEYEKFLSKTDVMVLPYRDAYRLRISRVAIEAMINGIPAVVTTNTTLWSDFQRLGAACPFDEESPEGLAAAIYEMADRFQFYSQQARQRAPQCRKAFSVNEFREIVKSRLAHDLTPSAVPQSSSKTASTPFVAPSASSEPGEAALSASVSSSSDDVRAGKCVGIVSLYDWLKVWDNYGTLLQNYALQRVLARCGYDSLWLTDAPTASSAWAKACNFFLQLVFSPRELARLVRAILRGSSTPDAPDKLAEFNKRHPRRFREFIDRHMRVSNQEAAGKIHALIVGSDNIWARVSNGSFLNFGAPECVRIAYAVSAPWTKLSHYWRHRARKMIKRIDRISVRESEGIKVCSEIGRPDAQQTLDPTLLLSRADWDTLYSGTTSERPRQGAFMLGYFLNLESLEDMRWQAIAETAEAMSLEPLVIPLQGAELVVPERYVFAPTPVGFLEAFANADCVVTNSYHGTIFAILNEKPFLVFRQRTAHDRGGERIPNLLQLLGLEDRLIEVNDGSADFVDKMTKPIDWKAVGKALSREREKSTNFLRESLAAV